MAFSEEVKGELARHMPSSTCCRETELETIIRLEGKANLYEDQADVIVTLGHAAATRKAFLLFKDLLQPKNLTLQRLGKKRGHRSYVVRIPHITDEEMRWVQAANEGLSSSLAIPDALCCRRAIVRAILLCRGSFSDPERQNHLEISLRDGDVTYVSQVIETFGIIVGHMQRKHGPIVYLKDGDAIVELLKQVGAHSALLRIEGIRVTKDVRNSINRLVNCETANVDRTVSAAMQQIEAIRRLDAHVGLHTLSEKLQEVATLRTQHPYATLQELAQLTSPPVSRSSVQYRLKRIVELAQKIS